MPKDLWPDFEIGTSARSPRSVIEEAGKGLDKKTNGELQFWTANTFIDGKTVNVSFTLYSPLLFYHFPFLRVRFPVDEFYPVALTADKLEEIVAKDEKELIAALATIFNAPSTVDTIKRLIALGQG